MFSASFLAHGNRRQGRTQIHSPRRWREPQRRDRRAGIQHAVRGSVRRRWIFSGGDGGHRRQCRQQAGCMALLGDRAGEPEPAVGARVRPMQDAVQIGSLRDGP